MNAAPLGLRRAENIPAAAQHTSNHKTVATAHKHVVRDRYPVQLLPACINQKISVRAQPACTAGDREALLCLHAAHRPCHRQCHRHRSHPLPIITFGQRVQWQMCFLQSVCALQCTTSCTPTAIMQNPKPPPKMQTTVCKRPMGAPRSAAKKTPGKRATLTRQNSELRRHQTTPDTLHNANPEYSCP